MISLLRNFVKALSRAGLKKFLEQQISASDRQLKILNIGAGGSIEKVLRSHFKEFDSLDIDPSRGPTIIGDLCEIDLGENQFDAVFLLEVLEHLHEPAAAINTIYRSLKSGGRLIASTPFMFPIHEEPRDFFRYTSFGLRYLLADFCNVQIIPKDKFSDNIYITVGRLLFSKNRGEVWIAVVSMVILFPLYPILKALSSRVTSENITSGYLICAVKP